MMINQPISSVVIYPSSTTPEIIHHPPSTSTIPSPRRQKKTKKNPQTHSDQIDESYQTNNINGYEVDDDQVRHLVEFVFVVGVALFSSVSTLMSLPITLFGLRLGDKDGSNFFFSLFFVVFG